MDGGLAERLRNRSAFDRVPPPVGDELALDGRPYRGLDGARFALQDEGGLVGLNWRPGRRLRQLLGELGVPAEKRSVLVARLRDYTDTDDLVRLNGAEAADYEDAGLPPPRNHRLRTVAELRAVLGWAEIESLWGEGGILPLASVTMNGGYNLNTSPAAALRTAQGIDEDFARRIVATRPHRSAAMASAELGRPIPISQLELGLRSSKHIRLDLVHPDLPTGRHVHLRLSPAGDGEAPQITEYEFEHPKAGFRRDAQATGESLLAAEDPDRP